MCHVHSEHQPKTLHLRICKVFGTNTDMYHIACSIFIASITTYACIVHAYISKHFKFFMKYLHMDGSRSVHHTHLDVSS